MKLFNRPTNILMSAAAVIFIVLGIFITDTLTSTAPTNPQTVSVAETAETGLVLPLAQLEGKWTAENNGVVFHATVAQRSIDIKMKTADGTTMNYWNGTFETAQSPGRAIESKVVETNEVYLSNAKTKTFQVGVDTLSFEFKAMGMTKIVTLKRN